MQSGLYSHPGIYLEQHLSEVAELIKDFSEQIRASDKFRMLSYITAMGHDLGKSTTYFQEHLKGKKVKQRFSSHALLSAVLTIWHVAQKLKEDAKALIFLAIRCHHSNPFGSPTGLLSLKHEWKYLQRQVKAINLQKFKRLLANLNLDIALVTDTKFLPTYQELRQTISKANLKEIPTYFIANLLLGMLVDADIRAVIGMKVNEREEIPDDIVDKYLQNMPKESPLDPLRQDFYSTVTENIQRFGLEEKFLSINAPTGLGKTLAGFSAAVRLRNMISKEAGKVPRIIYVLPYTSIIDQTYKVISDMLESLCPKLIGMLIKHHYRSAPKLESIEKDSGIIDPFDFLEEHKIYSVRKLNETLKTYERAHTRVETWDGEIIITTFVRFYETLFTNKRSEMRRLHRLAGSIVILDEVQNIPAGYWEATEEALTYLSKAWDTRFILMTATRPALFQNILELTHIRRNYFFENLSRTKLKVEKEQIAILRSINGYYQKFKTPMLLWLF